MSGWWFAASASAGHAVDEGDRRGEVGELQVAHDRVVLAAPFAALQALVDLLV